MGSIFDSLSGHDCVISNGNLPRSNLAFLIDGEVAKVNGQLGHLSFVIAKDPGHSRHLPEITKNGGINKVVLIVEFAVSTFPVCS